MTIDLEARDSNADAIVQPSDIHDDHHREGGASLHAREWFTRRKRGLLAPFGVGTVDQSLLAILSTPHHFVRLFGLAGKTVIFDEVHAYDVYMTTLFERLMLWLAAIGSSVVVLSATLPDQRRRQLLSAYAQGAGLSDHVLVERADYPRVSWVSEAGSGVVEVGTSPEIRRELKLEWLAAPDGEESPWAGLADWLLDALTEGGCAAVICNTVRHAQEAYQALRAAFPDVAEDGESELDLLHARFPFEDRDVRERRALRRFGKPGGTVTSEDGTSTPVRRPRRAVLVATQVIEQSLDLDFDVIVSEIAPVDLLLQRSGRLHRHQRDFRPSGLEQPVLWLLPAELHGTIPVFRGGTPYVYDPHILFRTWFELEDRASIAIPDDVGALIEAVYDRERPIPDSLSAEQRDHWETTLRDSSARQRSDAQQAHVRAIPDPLRCERIAELTPTFLAEDSPEIHRALQAMTRLTGPSVSVICLYETERGYALNPGGKEVVDISRTPTIGLARRMLRRSVTISTMPAAGRLVAVDPPASWHESSLLRHHRMAAFDSWGRATVGDVALQLDPQLGILIDRRRTDVI